MPSFESLQKKIQAFKAIVAEKSISPKLVGSLLEDIIQLIKDTVSAGSNGESMYVKEAGYAATAGTADEATHAANADFADEATHAVNADNALEAAHAVNADKALEADEAKHAINADEATHAASAADLDADSPVREEFLSSKNDDTAEGLIKFLKGLLSGNYKAGTTGGKLDANGDLEVAAALVRGLLQAWGGVRIGTGSGTAEIDADGNAEFGGATVRLLLSALGGIFAGDYEAGAKGGKFDADGNIEAATAIVRGLLKAAKLNCPDIITDKVSTELFSDGFAGSGFRLWKDASGATHLTVDTLTVRRVMTVFEMLIARIRSVGGTLFVSAANGKIESTSRQSSGSRLITFEDGYHGFVAGDYMRCQTFRGSESKSYWVRIGSVTGKTVTVPASEWTGQSIPEAGDEVVLCGSDNAARQSGILISATEDGKPRIEVLNGISGKSFDGCLRVRLGYLDDIVDDENFPGDLSPKGYGIYSDNAYFKGEFVLSGNGGGNIRTLFAAMGDRITAVVADVDNKIASQITVEAGKIKSDVLAELTGENGAITNLQTQITQNADAISAQATKVDGNSTAIAALQITAGDIKSDVAKLSGDLETAKTSIEQNADAITAQATKVDGNSKAIAALQITADGIRSDVTKLNGDLETAKTSIEQNTDAISAQATKVDGNSKAISQLQITAGGISSTISAMQTEMGKQSEHISKVEQTADSIKAEVTDGLKTTGIDIENGLITLNGDTKFVDSSGKTTAMFKDGKLSAALIDADSLTARRVEVQYPDSGKPCVTIRPEDKGMNVYDENGKLVQEFSGLRRQNALEGDTGGDIAFYASPTIYYGGMSALSTPWPAAGEEDIPETMVLLDDGTMTLSASVRAQTTGSGLTQTNTAEITVRVDLESYPSGTFSKTIVSRTLKVQPVDNAANSRTVVINLGGKYAEAMATGKYRIVAYAYRTLVGTGSFANVTFDGLAGRHVDGRYVSRYFANGMALQRSSEDYVCAIHNSDGMKVEARMGGYGIRMSRNGIRMLTAAGHWDRVSLPFFRGYIRYKNGTLFPSVDTMGRYSIEPAVTAVGSTGIDVTVPEEWRTIHGAGFEDRAYVRIFPSTLTCRAAVAWFTNEVIRISYDGPLPEEMLLEIDII